MKITLFYHSLISDWNHGNAHFLRGVYAALLRLGHDVRVYEPTDGWSYTNLVKQHGTEAVENFYSHFPHLKSTFYHPGKDNLETLVKDSDLVIVHEWNDPQLVKAIGEIREKLGTFRLLFHDTHHRSVSAAAEMERYDLRAYDGVLAFGKVIKEIYLRQGWARQAWTWHEAADTDTYHPMVRDDVVGDLVWIGNWGDDERSDELHEYIIHPVMQLGLKARFYGVRYPEKALKALKGAGIEYGGWLPAHRVAHVFSKFRVTVHVPRRPYVTSLSGIPTIRPFEAMACKIPLISAPWKDSEELFTEGKDYLLARDGEEMKHQLQRVLNDQSLAENLCENGLATIQQHHTCLHRAEELINIYHELSKTPAHALQH